MKHNCLHLIKNQFSEKKKKTKRGKYQEQKASRNLKNSNIEGKNKPKNKALKAGLLKLTP